MSAADGRRSIVRRMLPWAVAVLLLAGAWFASAVTPDGSDATRAFVIDAQLGQRTVGRNLAVTVHDVRAARAISTDAGWSAQGTWVVVSLDAEAVRTQYGTLLDRTALKVGDRTYQATERGAGADFADTMTLAGVQLVPGIPKTGMLAFQLPENALTGTATLELAAESNPAYDSIIDLRIRLDELPVESDVEIVPVSWSGS